MNPKLTAVTLGVKSVPASARFYEALGLQRKVRATGDEIAFYEAGGVVLALWDWTKLADDSVVPGEPRPPAFRGSTLAWNCASAAEVDAIFAHALKVGAGLLRKPEKTDYGGYRGCPREDELRAIAAARGVEVPIGDPVPGGDVA